ncbi:hypothetical protein ACFO0N_01640 [Halobium salinum]|uniref:Uncharacterized protein n=1 Tax=Halobium salinum TaxID=1364940 RepID=A0ABD5P6Y6_9EURY|nr:hypothetical protein [Halobium salinum]
MIFTGYDTPSGVTTTATDSPQAKEEFSKRIQALIRSAESNGVDIERGYVFQSESGDHDQDPGISPVVRESKGQ